MRLEWIDDILAVLDNGSLARAAERRFLTQSAFTRRVRMIEVSIGTTLFDRRRKPVAVTAGVQALEPELRDLIAPAARRVEMVCEPDGQVADFRVAARITTTVSPCIVRSLIADGGSSVRVRAIGTNA